MGLPLAIIVFTQCWLSDEKLSEKVKSEEVKGKGSKKKRKKENKEIVASIPELSTFNLFSFFPLTQSAKRMIFAGIVGRYVAAGSRAQFCCCYGDGWMPGPDFSDDGVIGSCFFICSLLLIVFWRCYPG